jgi:ribose 1,5-bisphosphokinase
MPVRLIYLMGPSGSGKDSLLAHARARLAGEAGVVFAHRYITRPADAGGENHVALSKEEFLVRRNASLFALDWESHGLCYGIGLELNLWLAKGSTVVVNGSREYLGEARRRYAELLPVAVTVNTQTLQRRLLTRGREDAEAIARRLRRLQDLPLSGWNVETIDNNGPLSQGGDALVALIRQQLRPVERA